MTFFPPPHILLERKLRFILFCAKQGNGKNKHKNVPGMSEIETVFSILLLNVRNSSFADTGFILALTVDAVIV